MIKLLHGNCLELMKSIPDRTIDAIITDPPYGTTACKWDSVIPFDLMWEQLNRIIKPNGAIVLFGSQPFTSVLVNSNIIDFKHEWIWQKNKGSNFANLKTNPFKEHESIIVFGKNKINYYPIKQLRAESGQNRLKYKMRNKLSDINGGKFVNNGNEFYTNPDNEKRNPSSIQKFNTENGLHPTQKPVLLMEYLIKTYTNENETVLDFTMGSGTTGVAAKNLNRNFIGIEMDDNYFEIAKERIN